MRLLTGILIVAVLGTTPVRGDDKKSAEGQETKLRNKFLRSRSLTGRPKQKADAKTTADAKAKRTPETRPATKIKPETPPVPIDPAAIAKSIRAAVEAVAAAAEQEFAKDKPGDKRRVGKGDDENSGEAKPNSKLGNASRPGGKNGSATADSPSPGGPSRQSGSVTNRFGRGPTNHPPGRGRGSGPAGRNGVQTPMVNSHGDQATGYQSPLAGRPRPTGVPRGWVRVRPSGTGWFKSRSALLTGTKKPSDSGGGDAATRRTLDGGAIRAAMRAGPNNPLVLPPNIASVVYVIDASGSMHNSRFRRVAEALVDAVAQMSNDQEFAVLLFTDVAWRIRGSKFFDAGPDAAVKLREELRRIPHGSTDPGDAMQIAVQMKPETIVVMSDGEFSQDIVYEITEQNRASGLNAQINCIACGVNVASLRLLASLNGPGNYVEAH